jgi:beta-lactamase regulating signal transducer with metallopeptidase domain
MILFDASIRITVVALLVAVILAAMRVRSSEVRHRTWAGVLVAMLLMPILPSLVPGIPLPIQLKPPALAGASQPAWTSAVNELPGLKPGPSTEGLTNLTPGIGQTIRFLPGESPVTVETQQTSMWWRVVAVTYLIGVVTLLVRMAAGWRAVGGLVRGARRTTLSHEIPVYESELVATPVTVGFAPSRIILPREWSRWPDHKLRACLAHETAHVRRRDPLIALIARVNTCIFWFHPLAWWLERTLAVSAEHAADAAAVRAIGNTRQYADVLLDIANSVRMHGSRVAWQGVGVDGTGLLGRRIDRLVRGEVDVALSRLRTGILFATCAIAVALVVACQQQPAAVAPLTPDPEVAARLERQRANEAFYKSAANMTAAEVDALERSLKRTPEDFESLRKLQQFYRSGSGQKVFGWNEMIARRRPHLLWLIENHPDHDLAAWTVSATSDPVGYAEAKKRWLAQVAKPDASEKTLLNAAHFFDRYDPRSAEELLIRAEAFRELGVFYAGIVNGYTSGGNPVRRPDDDEYQKIALQRLLTSDNAAMVGAASDRLGFGIRNQADRDRAAQVLRRALALDPKRERARELLDSFERQEQEAGLNESLHRRGLELAGKEIAAKIEQRQALTDVEKATLQQARRVAPTLSTRWPNMPARSRTAPARSRLTQDRSSTRPRPSRSHRSFASMLTTVRMSTWRRSHSRHTRCAKAIAPRRFG